MGGGRKPLSSYPPDVAAKMRADLSQKMRDAWALREQNGLGQRKNGVYQPGVSAQIAESVRQAWLDGDYAARQNGTAGRTGSQSPGWTWGKRDYAAILTQHEPPACAHCGTTEELNAHHVDESHANYLLSNLLWLCVPCHAHRYHYRRSRTPFMTLGKIVRFEYAHVLPWHPGACARLHGHSGSLTAEVRARLDPNGVVLDFYDVGECLKRAVAEQLDHQFLNDLLPNPTSENLLLWCWHALESIGLKGLRRLTFSETVTTSATVTVEDMLEAYGWDRDEQGRWVLIEKPYEER